MTVAANFMPPSSAPFVGVGLKNQHLHKVLEQRPCVDFFEIHAENYMNAGGAHHRYLSEITEEYKLSVHGVGMSLGSADGLCKEHMKHLKDVVERYKPILVSEHLAWTNTEGAYLNDLLPLPLNEQSFAVVRDNIHTLQDYLGQKILVENPSVYVSFAQSIIPEAEFLNRLVAETGCGLLLDINNIYVSASNTGFEPGNYLSLIEKDFVAEVHLAGHVARQLETGQEILIDDHGSPVCEAVWALFASFISMTGPVATLVEWDTNIPSLQTLEKEADLARQQILLADKTRLCHAI